MVTVTSWKRNIEPGKAETPRDTSYVQESKLEFLRPVLEEISLKSFIEGQCYVFPLIRPILFFLT